MVSQRPRSLGRPEASTTIGRSRAKLSRSAAQASDEVGLSSERRACRKRKPGPSNRGTHGYHWEEEVLVPRGGKRNACARLDPR